MDSFLACEAVWLVLLCTAHLLASDGRHACWRSNHRQESRGSRSAGATIGRRFTSPLTPTLELVAAPVSRYAPRQPQPQLASQAHRSYACMLRVLASHANLERCLQHELVLLSSTPGHADGLEGFLHVSEQRTCV